MLALHSRLGDASLLRMVVRTLDGMAAGLYDQKDQGFFRYSVARDWKVPHYEKMLTTNASLATLYLEAYQVTGKAGYKNLAAGALDYLLNQSQGGNYMDSGIKTGVRVSEEFLGGFSFMYFSPWC